MERTNNPAPEATRSWVPTTASQAAFVVPPELADHPRYRLVEVLGEGGMGRVFKAEHRLMNRWVAIKVVRDALLDKPALRERFVRELRTAGQLAHPNIVAAHDAEQAGNSCFLVMEYVAGESLSQLVKRRGPLPVAEACDYVRQAAMGLQYAHERGLVHRDIKPGNLMLTADGVVKVLDFGLARFSLARAVEQTPDAKASAPQPARTSDETVSSAGVGTPFQVVSGQERAVEHTASGAVLGTPAYMAPEQARNARAADIRADIYSLGCTLSCLLYGKPPANDANPVSRADIPAELTATLKRMMALNPAERLQTPADVVTALLSHCPPRTAVGQLTPTSPAKRRRPRIEVLIGLIALCALVVYIIVKSTSPEQRADDGNEGLVNNVTDDVPANRDRDNRPETDRPAGQRPTTGRGLTSIVIQVSPQPPVSGQPIKFTVFVTALSPPDRKPEGGVTFYDGEKKLGYAGLENGVAELTTKEPAPGQHMIRVAYDGDEAYGRSFSPSVNVTVQP